VQGPRGRSAGCCVHGPRGRSAGRCVHGPRGRSARGCVHGPRGRSARGCVHVRLDGRHTAVVDHVAFAVALGPLALSRRRCARSSIVRHRRRPDAAGTAASGASHRCSRSCAGASQPGRDGVRGCVATPVAPPRPTRDEVSPENEQSPAFAGLFPCAEEDSNLHGPYSPQGPQPCASTNSATGAGGTAVSAAGERSIARG
jgi:hypothetical protein